MCKAQPRWEGAPNTSRGEGIAARSLGVAARPGRNRWEVVDRAIRAELIPHQVAADPLRKGVRDSLVLQPVPANKVVGLAEGT